MQDLLSLELLPEDVMQGKYLTFQVGDGAYGIEIKFVTEIIGVQEITPVPHTHHYVKGIMNLRGTIVPVIDMRLRFGLDETAYTDRTCIVVLSMDDITIGLIVDAVEEVLDIGAEHLRQLPQAKADGLQNHFVKEIGLSDGEVKQLLDIEKVFEMDQGGGDAD